MALKSVSSEVSRRKLAAIMFTDLVGYTRLSHSNEGLAMQLLEEHRELVRSILARFLGREIKTVGDAFLVEFESPVDACRCAIAIQTAFHARNRRVPSGEKLRLRIGVHLGDVLAGEGDVLGDGVNLAARLQSLAKPGSVFISRQVFDQIQGKISSRIVPVGRQRVRGIEHPVDIFSITPIEPRWPERLRSMAGRRGIQIGLFGLGLFVGAWALWKPAQLGLSRLGSGGLEAARRVAVLPIQVQSADSSRQETLDYVADGLTDEMISGLTRIPGLGVLARTTVNAHRGLTIRELSRTLQAGRLVIGSIRTAGEKIRISLQLVDGRTEETLWTHEVEGSLAGVYPMQRELVDAISRTLRPRSEPESVRQASSVLPKPQTYLKYLQGSSLLRQRNASALRAALELFQSAINEDPDFALGYHGMATVHGLFSFYGLMEPKTALNRAKLYREKTLALDPDEPAFLIGQAMDLWYLDLDRTGAEAVLRRALAEAPGDVSGQIWYAHLLMSGGRFAEADARLAVAERIDPLAVVGSINPSLVKYYEGRFAEALKLNDRALALSGETMNQLRERGLLLSLMNRHAEAVETLGRAVKTYGEITYLLGPLGYAAARAGDRPRARAILFKLRARSQVEFVSPYAQAMVFQGLGESSSAVKELMRALETRDGLVVWLGTDPVFQSLRANSEFRELVRELRVSSSSDTR